MKILLVGCFKLNNSINDFYVQQFIMGLANSEFDLHTICPSDFASINEFNFHLPNHIQNEKFSIIFSESNEKVIFIDTLKKLRKLARTVLMCMDNGQDPFPFINVAKHYDLVWLFDKGNQDYFKRWGANYHYLPWGANSSFKVTRDYNESLIQRVVFIGNPYGSRVKMINELLKSGIPVDMYIAGGSNQPALKVSKIKYLFKYVYENRYRLYYFIRLIQTNYGRKIFFSRLYSLVSRNLDFSNKNLRVYDRLDYENISLVIQSYRLVLNSAYLNSTGYLINPIEIINLRTFEIPALGGLQLVQESIEISRFFEDGYDIVFYNRRNLKEVIKKYLHDVSDSTIIEMRSKAFEKVKKMHNWSARFSEISKLLRF